MSSRVLEGWYTELIARLDPRLRVAEALRDIDLASTVSVIAFGKASVAMAQGACDSLGSRVVAVVGVADSLPENPGMGTWMTGSHPRPDDSSVAAARALIDEVENTRAEEILFLVSGGGSALVSAPRAPISIAEKALFLERVSRAGVGIAELNQVRVALSQVKGGQLAARSLVPVCSLVCSDVPGDDLTVVASGPTIAPPVSPTRTSLQIARGVLGTDIPPAIVSLLQTPPVTPSFRERHYLVSGIETSGLLATEIAREYGFFVSRHDLEGDVEEAAKAWTEIARNLGDNEAAIGVGETTISIGEAPGNGGRAQHLGLLLARSLLRERNLVVMSAGTDGKDGNSDFAGAVISGSTWDQLREKHIDPEMALSRCDSSSALGAIGARIRSGKTGVNHADIVIAVRSRGLVPS